MSDARIETTITGGQIQGVAGAGSVVIENFTIYNRAVEETPAAEAGPIAPCPYPGLAYFGPSDAELFFGRDAAIERLAEAVGRQSLTTLVGASGSGKSSVVLAGLAPRLHEAGGWRSAISASAPRRRATRFWRSPVPWCRSMWPANPTPSGCSIRASWRRAWRRVR
jgi:hypothetical protein